MNGTRTFALSTLCLLAVGAPALAQEHAPASRAGAAPAQPPAAPAARWEIEGYGGLSLARIPTGGSTALPLPGPAITTSSPIFPTRQTSSWFFGDGAALLNDAAAELSLPNRLSPLDSAIGTLAFDAPTGAVFGLRVRRSLMRGLAAEFSVDVMAASQDFSSEFVDAVETSRSSFETAFSSLLSSGPFSGSAVRATATTTGGSSREIATTGAVHYIFGARGGFVPYVTAGGGVISRTGTLPSVVLEGNYRFAIDGVVPVNETDRVTVRFEQDAAFVGLGGGGLVRDVSDRWGFRIDARVLLGPPTGRVLLDASPSAIRGTPADFIESFTYPSIQFSNDPATGRQSTLGGPPLQGFTTLTSEGVQTRVLVTVGVFRRF